ncbi:toxin [Listeria booriae]|uniref:toxin n=1 Tax=Listeria booriae TaxID=1552123 RepID=UPI00164CEFAE|nr:toxin [Listeria booriae]MBC6133489.1 toxin [Listeria booriae]
MITEHEYLIDYYSEIPVIECDLYADTGLYGAYRNGHILLEKRQSIRDKKIIVMEEIQHHKSSVGTIIDETNINNKKQENFARNLVYDNFITIATIIHCHNQGFVYYYEVAEYLNLPEEFIQDAVEYYRLKYGAIYKTDGYTLYFGSAIEICNEDIGCHLYDYGC